MSRIVIIGPPRSGKSTLARQIRQDGIPTLCTDSERVAPYTEPGVTYAPDFDGDWSALAEHVATVWMRAPGSWCIEGVGAVYALRYLAEHDPDTLRSLVILRTERQYGDDILPGHLSMAKAVETVWQSAESMIPSENVLHAQSRQSRRDHALALRKFSLDLVPATAYRTEPNAAEARIDVQASEADEGRALESARVHLGIALSAQLQDVIAAVTHPRFSPRTSKLSPDTSDIEIAFARLTALGTFDGFFGYHRNMLRAEPDRQTPDSYGLTAVGTEEMLLLGLSLGRRFARSVLDGVQKVLDQALSANYTTEQIVEAIEASYAGLLQITEYPLGLRVFAAQVEPKQATPKVVTRRRGRRMKVQNREQYEQWQREFLPFSKRMRQTLESYQAEAAHVPKLKAETSKEWLQTEYTRARSHATILEANADPAVDKLVYSVWKQGLACGLCLKRNGIVRKKDDPWWQSNTPPLHNKCMCEPIPLLRADKFKVTPKPDLPDADFELQPGYGGFDPNRVRNMRRLGRAIR